MSWPDYFRIRQMEREEGLPLTPFPDWLPGIVMPAELAARFGLINPTLTWAEAAELYESGAFDDAPGATR